MLPVFTPASATPMQRSLDIINAGIQPVYAIRIGHRATGTWSADLLGPTGVVDVGAEQSVRVQLQDTCWYDVRFRYRDGRGGELDDVDLCSAVHVFLKTNAR